MPTPNLDAERNRVMRERVRAVLDDDEFVLAVVGALEAVAEHAFQRAIGADRFTEMARDAYDRFVRGRLGDPPVDDPEWEVLPDPPASDPTILR